MALKMAFDKQEDIPEAIRTEYVEKNGKWVIDVEGIEDLPALTTTLGKERKARADLEKKVKKWEGLGKTDEEIQQLIQEHNDAQTKKTKDEGDFDKLLTQHKDAWAKEKADLETELTTAHASERRAIIGTSLLTALTKAGATEEGLDLLPDRLSSRVKFETKDGERVIQIMQADGETPMAGKGKGGEATFEDLVAEALDKFPSLFKAEGGGSGRDAKGRGNGKAKTMTRAELNQKSPAERMKIMQKGEITIVD